MTRENDSSMFGTESIGKIFLKVAPPVMFAQLIQALYNIVDSYFVGKFSGDGLTALSVIFPIQLIIIALGVGTGVVLAVLTWIAFSLLTILFLRYYVELSAKSPKAVEYSMSYGLIVCVGSLGIFLESIFTKVHQAGGNMRIPMAAQIVGAVINIVLDPLLIFGMGPFPEMGVAGAAIATVIGQFVAAFITGAKGMRKPPEKALFVNYAKKIYKLGYPYMFMQFLATLYIVILNIILADFCDEAVAVLGLYYKLQTFFFIPLFAFQTCSCFPCFSCWWVCSVLRFCQGR